MASFPLRLRFEPRGPRCGITAFENGSIARTSERTRWEGCESSSLTVCLQMLRQKANEFQSVPTGSHFVFRVREGLMTSSQTPSRTSFSGTSAGFGLGTRLSAEISCCLLPKKNAYVFLSCVWPLMWTSWKNKQSIFSCILEAYTKTCLVSFLYREDQHITFTDILFFDLAKRQYSPDQKVKVKSWMPSMQGFGCLQK